jgi:multidrug resistance efflux pump
MQPLRKRLRPDNIPNEKRVERGRTGRTIYLVLLGLFSITVANYLLGDFFLLDADGLVLRDQHVVATTYVARVEDVDVREGQEVKEGAALLKLQSTEILERLADLSTKQADIIAKITDFKVRAESVSKLLPLAERREAEAAQAIRQFDTLLEGKYVTSVRYEEALRANYEATRERVTLLTQGNVLKEELTSLDRARDDADDALSKLQAIYADGLVHSPVNGSIGSTIPSVGTVYRPGDPILSIYSGEPYVLVYLPRRYLFTIRTGMEVRITDGREVADGVVTEILPLTDTLPKEFQNTFKPSDRNQLAKIKISAPSPFPLNQKVSVSRHMPLGGLVEIRKLLGLSDAQVATRAP